MTLQLTVEPGSGLPADGWAVPGVTGVGSVEPAGLPPVSEPVAQLQQLLAAEAAVVASEVPEAQALADVAGLLSARDSLERLLLARLGDVETRGLTRHDGAVSTSSWLRAHAAELPAGTLATARRLVRHAGLAQAVAEGRLSPRQAEQVSRALVRVRTELDRPDGLIDGHDAQPVLAGVLVDGVLGCLGEALGGVTDDSPGARLLDELADQLSELAWQTQTSQLDRLERGLILLAEHLPTGWLPTALSTLTGALLPQRLEDAADRADHERRLSLTPLPDGGGHVCGQLTPEAYELLHTALDAAMQTDPDNPADTDGYRRARQAGWAPGDPLPDHVTGPSESPAAATPVRSRPQRLHDGLVLALRALLDSAALGTRGKAAPHISVTIGLGALNGAPGALPARGASGQALPLSLVTRWMRDAWVTRFVLGLRHRVVETSHSERTLKAHERRIKNAETGRACQAAGCPRGPNPPPGTRLIPHHPDSWARTRTTSVGDTVLLCEYDHTQLHDGATLTLRDGRRVTEQGWLR